MFFQKPRWYRLLASEVAELCRKAVGPLEKYRKSAGIEHDVFSGMVTASGPVVMAGLLRSDKTISQLESSLPEADRWAKVLRLRLERKLSHVALDTPTSWLRGALRELQFTRFSSFVEMAHYAIEVETREGGFDRETADRVSEILEKHS